VTNAERGKRRCLRSAHRPAGTVPATGSRTRSAGSDCGHPAVPRTDRGTLPAPLSFLCHSHSHPGFQPLTPRQTHPTDDPGQGHFKENATLYFATRRTPGTARCRVARCANPPQGPCRRSNGLAEKNSVARKRWKKHSLSCFSREGRNKVPSDSVEESRRERSTPALCLQPAASRPREEKVPGKSGSQMRALHLYSEMLPLLHLHGVYRLKRGNAEPFQQALLVTIRVY